MFRAAAVVAALLGAAGPAVAQDNPGVVMERHLLGQLDTWVAEGGDLSQVANTLAPTCSQLAVLIATEAERDGFLNTNREEYNLRVDVCTKITMHRVHPQPEFGDPRMMSLVCDRGLPLYQRLCRQGGFR